MARRKRKKKLKVRIKHSLANSAMIARAAGYSAITLLLILAVYAIDLPSVKTLEAIEKRPSITIQTNGGLILATYGDLYGKPLTYKDFPPFLIEAALATEDRNFFHHFGIDLFGIARAMVHNLMAGEIVEGGSTITQQLAKNLFLKPKRTLTRKMQEMILSLWLEHRFTKQQILTLYLNRVYFGAGSFGVDAASQRYFGKSVRQLNRKETAMLVGLLKAPSRYSPTNNPELSDGRANQILDNMVDAEFLTEKQAAAAKLEKVNVEVYRAKSQGILYFGDWVMEQLADFIGEPEEDLIVTVTLDPAMQKAAEEAVENIILGRAADFGASQAALVAMSPDGEVKAMVGGIDYRESQFNRATQAQRQPGSAFKFFVYLAGLESGFTPDSTFIDEPIAIKKWRPENYNGKYLGEMRLREAFAQSINTIAVQLSEATGRSKVIAMAKRLGIQSPILNAPSLALGTNEVNLLELTGAYAYLANQGEAVVPVAINGIKTRSGKVLYKRKVIHSPPLLKGSVIGMMNELLQGVVDHGTGRAAYFGRPVAGKTGTSQDFRDAWFIGFAPQLVAGVWVGNDDNSPMEKVTGGKLPAQVWARFMEASLNKTPALAIPKGGRSDGGAAPESGGFWEDLWQVLEGEPRVIREYPEVHTP